ncbi:MAG: NUDIX domain-containing protein [Armatimonadetes bacterium]|nr:NUDIX domain-containing protein [Akkermansiaceae bacterium]
MKKIVNIIQRQQIFHRFVFRIDELKLTHERYDGTMSPEITRLILERGDSVAVLLHDTETDILLLCEQFRAPTLEKDSGWMVEVLAGILESGEEPEECAQREAFEETGYAPRALQRIACVYLSPGGSSERIHLYYAEVSLTDKVGGGGGLVAEAEDIRLIRLPVKEALAQAATGAIRDAKTLIAIQWLELQRSGRNRLSE